MSNANAKFWLLATAVSLAIGCISPSQAQGDPATEALRQVLSDKYPNTQFGKIERTPLPGIYEVWMGNNVAYVMDDARYFIFGHLFDMQTQVDLTAGKKNAVAAQRPAAPQTSVSFADLPFQNAIKTVRGNGQRQVAVFSDPDCPYCRQLEGNLAKLDNVTIYTFLYPIAALHQSAATKAEKIWCAKDRSNAWRDYMLMGKLPKATHGCKTPIDANIDLANRVGIMGTPYIVFANGEKSAGAMDVAALERALSGK